MRKLLLLLPILLGLVVAAPHPVTAQDDSWVCHFDFSAGELGWTSYVASTDGGGLSGATFSSDRWNSVLTGGSYPYDDDENLSIQHSLTATEITNVSYTTSGSGAYTWYISVILFRPIGDPTYYSGTSASPGLVDFSTEGEANNIVVYAARSGNHDGGPGTHSVLDVTVSGIGEVPFDEGDCAATEEWTRPLRQADELPDFGVYDYNVIESYAPGFPAAIENFIAPSAQYRVTGLSQGAGKPVMAAHAGTVSNIEYASAAMCSVWGVLIADVCLFASPNDAEVLQLYQFQIDSHVNLVTIDLGDGTELRYIVSDATLYLKLGDTVEAGCVIGETIEAEAIPTNRLVNIIQTIVANFVDLGGLLGQGDLSDFGITLIEYRNPEEVIPVVPLLDKLTVYNEANEPCNINQSFKDCFVANPEMRRGADQWTILGDNLPFDTGIVIGVGSYVEQQINLPDSGDYEVIFVAEPYYFRDLGELIGGGTPKPRKITVKLGQDTQEQALPISDAYAEYTLSFTAPTADLGGTFYTFRITNTGEGDVALLGGCVSTTDRELNPQMCYFQDFSFDNGVDEWEPDGGVVGYSGYASLPNGGSVAQNVTLSEGDDPPATYTLEVEARIRIIDEDGFSPETGTASLAYQIGSDTPVSIGSLDLSYNQSGQPGYPDIPEKLSVEIEVPTTVTDSFKIIATIADNANVVAIALDKACLSAGTSGTPGNLPFKPTCGVISQPEGSDFGKWISWHWSNLSKFFRCELMILLNKMYKLSQDAYRLMQYTVRWGLMFTAKSVRWLDNDLLPWLNGQFRNIAVGQVTNIYEGAGGPSLWDVLLALVNNVFGPTVAWMGQLVGLLVGIVTQVFNLLLALVVSIIGLVIAFLIKALSLLLLAQQLLASIITAYSGATPTPIPGFPNCVSDPKSNPVCVGVWVLDNTIFSGTGSAIIPIIVGVFSIHLILWVVSDLRRVVLEMGQVS